MDPPAEETWRYEIRTVSKSESGSEDVRAGGRRHSLLARGSGRGAPQLPLVMMKSGRDEKRSYFGRIRSVS